MPHKTPSPDDHIALRTRAVSRLRGDASTANLYADTPNALGVLYDLASSPETAPNALALLHELQVHQVEVDLQAEELRRSRADLEVSLSRQLQLYDAAPIAYVTIDPDTNLRELNLTAVKLLGLDREMLVGRALASFLAPQTRSVLHGMLDRLAQGSASTQGALRIMGVDGALHLMHASASRDPAGERYLLALAGTDHTLTEATR
jgi:PAS domain S-box-containing protein